MGKSILEGIVLLFLLIALLHFTFESAKNASDKKDHSANYEIVTIDSCEYIMYNNTILHKQNCLNHKTSKHCIFCTHANPPK